MVIEKPEQDWREINRGAYSPRVDNITSLSVWVTMIVIKNDMSALVGLSSLFRFDIVQVVN